MPKALTVNWQKTMLASLMTPMASPREVGKAKAYLRHLKTVTGVRPQNGAPFRRPMTCSLWKLRSMLDFNIRQACKGRMRYIHTMKFSHKKSWSTDICYDVGGPQKHYAEQRKSDTNGHTLWGSIHVKRAAQASPEMEGGRCGQGLGEGGVGGTADRCGPSFGGWKCSGTRHRQR